VVLTVRDGVAILTIDNPPVNALGAQSIPPLLTGLADAEADAEVGALVITGAHGTFSGGADMKAFGANPPLRPHVRDLIERLDASAKPIVAALEGNAMGGGLELALACDYRVAARGARLALPEIKRGLLPGAGGTQRLPRLIGVGAALEMILGGDPVDAQRAAGMGLVDAVAEGDLLDAAVAFARAHAGSGRRRTSSGLADLDDGALDAARLRAQPADRGGLAEREAIEAVADAARLPYDEGLARERSRFVALLDSEQAKARIYLFFAEREAAKLPDGTQPPPFTVGSVAVIGSGTMGSGIAAAAANAGIAVTLIDVRAELVERAREIIAGNYAATKKKGRLTEAEMQARLARITTATSLDAAASADLVIEAVFEEMAVKQDVFRQLDRIAAPHAVLATNTSTLDVDAIGGVTSRPQDVVGLHFFSPANVMRLLEIVRGANTGPATVGRAMGIAKQLGKIGVVAGNCEGFIGNRMLHGYLREAGFLLEEGATPQQVDRVIRAFGFAMGPFAMSDLAGLDVGWRIRKGKHAIAPPAGRYSRVADALCEAGRFGQKTGAGYYRYRDGDRTPIQDPEVIDLVDRLARLAGIKQRLISDDEVLARCMYPLINEAAAILDEGIAVRPGDIDVVWANGYGFPAFRGGPLRWADSVGLPAIVAAMETFESRHGAAWTPAPLLRELAASHSTFGAWRPRIAAWT
jgi:3-hydroxyacyl-CoA dehydrogenase